jgi:hypothetical protein
MLCFIDKKLFCIHKITNEIEYSFISFYMD